MEVQESIRSARERTVIAMMKNCLDKTDELKVEVKELELLMGPEDSQVNLMYILTQASRRSSSIFEIFSTSGRSGKQKPLGELPEEKGRAATHKKVATKATFAGLRQVKSLQEEC